MKDYLQEEMGRREEIIDTIREVFRLYGFEPLSTPAVESLDVLSAKGGDEVHGQIFKIEGGMGLRFDLTVPFARVAAGTTFAKPFKRYCIAPVWRREEPQKGRLREFLQADVDIVGASSMRAEAELLACAAEALRRLGFAKFRVRLNDRKVLNGMLDNVGIAGDAHTAVLRALDKIEKQGAEVAKAEMRKAGVAAEKIEKIMAFTSMSGSDEKILAECKKYSSEGAAELSELLALCKEYELECELDLALVRGLDYYTGPIFEIDAGPGVGSVAGGGRYDNMLAGYGHGAPATGISLGIERIMALLSEKGKAEKKQRAYIAPLGKEQYAYAVKVANELRANGICCELDMMERPIAKQLQYAATIATHAIIIGEKEQKAGTVKIKDLQSGKEEEVALSDAATMLS